MPVEPASYFEFSLWQRSDLRNSFLVALFMTPYTMGLIHELKVANVVGKDNQNDGKEIGERVCKPLTTMTRVSNKRKILELLLDECIYG